MGTSADSLDPLSLWRLLKASLAFATTALSLLASASEFTELDWAGRGNSAGEADLEGAAAALFRLQDVYGLSAGELAEGGVPGAVNDSSVLSADDAFHLGYAAAQNLDFYHALHWLFLAEVGCFPSGPAMTGLSGRSRPRAHMARQKGNTGLESWKSIFWMGLEAGDIGSATLGTPQW